MRSQSACGSAKELEQLEIIIFMTRKNFAKGILAFTPFAAQAAKKQCYPITSIWETPQGQYVKMLRKEIERLDHWDDLDEDWQLVEDALRDGHMFFDVLPSREYKNKLLYRVRPVFYEKVNYGEKESIRKTII